MRPTRSVPGGCVIGLAGLAAWLYAGLCMAIIYRIWRNQKWDQSEVTVWHLTWQVIIALAIGAALLVVGWKLAIKVGLYDPQDPNEPRMKF